MSRPKFQLLEQAAITQPHVARSSLYPPAATTSVDGSGSFMRAPREIRDNIYRFLLSTKHTKDTLRCNYTYRFHTPIFFINRQVYHEASDIFYMEHLFIRVSLAGKTYHPDYFRRYKHKVSPHDSGLPILSRGTKALNCKRHVMEIDLLPANRSYSHHRDHQFIIACDDLPRFCRTLLRMNRIYYPVPLLLTTELWIIIGDEVGTAGKGSPDSNMSTDGNSKEPFTAATKKAAASLGFSAEDPRISGEGNDFVCGDMKGGGSTTVDKIEEAKSRLSQWPTYINNPRLQRLLEPFRALYSVGCSYIDAPISEQYRLEIFNSLSRARPSIHDLFLAVSSAFEEATAVYGADNTVLVIQRLKGTLDIMDDLLEHSRDRDINQKVMTGRYTGLRYREAMRKMQCLIWNNLAQANLKFPNDLEHVRTAQKLTLRIIDQCECSDVRLGDLPPRGYEHANVYYLEAEVWEVLDQLGEHNGRPRSDAFGDVVRMLTEALRHEPRNAMLKKELQRRLKERTTAEMMEEVREMERDEGKVMKRKRTR